MPSATPSSSSARFRPSFGHRNCNVVFMYMDVFHAREVVDIVADAAMSSLQSFMRTRTPRRSDTSKRALQSPSPSL